MHVLCCPVISKSDRSSSISTNIAFWHPFLTIYVFNFNLVLNHFLVIFIFSLANTHLLTSVIEVGLKHDLLIRSRESEMIVIMEDVYDQILFKQNIFKDDHIGKH